DDRSRAACARRGQQPAPWRCEALPGSRLELGDVDAIPGIELPERRMGQRALQIPPDPGNVSKVLRLMIASVQTCKNPEDFRRALRRHRRVSLDEGRRIEARVSVAPSLHVATEQRYLHDLRHVDAGILQQRCNVICGWADHRVLKVEQTDALD